MPLMLVLLVAAACLPVPWPPPVAGTALPPDERAGRAAALTAVAVLVPLLAASVLSAWVVRTLEAAPFRRPTVVRAYGRVRRLLGYTNLGAAAAGLWWGGWGWAVWSGWDRLRVPAGDDGGRVLIPGGELLVPLPYFLMLAAGWVIYFPAERALHRAAAGPRAEFWTLPGFVLFHARQFVLLVLFPAVLFSAQNGLTRGFPGLANSDAFHLAALAGMAGLFVLLPRAVKPLLGLTPLPPGPTRDRLEATARRLNFRYTDLLLWPTRGAVANAMVLGVVRHARYVVFTDRLLDSLEPAEVDAVFGHEVGHVRHRHIPFYALFFVLSAAAATAGFALVGEATNDAGLTTPEDWAGWLTVPPVAAMGAYLFVVFGLLSRRCERQADVFGCRAGSCGDPRCQGHGPETVLPPGEVAVCPTGVRALMRALDRVADLNGMDGPGPGARRPAARLWALVRAWQHGPIADRVLFLARLAEDPTLGDRTDRRVFRFRVGLTLALAVAVAVLGSAVGWDRLWRMM